MNHIERVGIDMNSPYIKTYTLQEVAKQICVPVGTIKRWEKALDELLNVPRTKQGARYYTEVEIAFLQKVKDLRESNSIGKIKTILLQQANQKQEQFNEEFLPPPPIHEKYSETETSAENDDINHSRPIIVHWQKTDLEAALERTQSEASIPLTKGQNDVIKHVENIDEKYETSLITRLSSSEVETKQETPKLEEFFKVMDAYKQSLLDEVKLEIRNGIRKEVIEEVKKEISKGSVQTVKALSNSIYKLSENTKSELQELSNKIYESSENTTENIMTLSHVITATSEHTSETIETLSNQLMTSSESTSETISALSSKIEANSENTKERIDYLTEEIVASSSTTTETIATLSDKIAQTSENTNETIATLTNRIAATSDNTSETITFLTKSFASASEDTKDSIQSLAEGFAISTKNTNESVHTLTRALHQASDETHHELRNLVDALNKDRELYIETLHQERMHFKQEIRTRETMFQDMVASFRNTAVTKEDADKKWWKFWK